MTARPKPMRLLPGSGLRSSLPAASCCTVISRSTLRALAIPRPATVARCKGAAGCASDRGQPAPAGGVQSIRAPLGFHERREEPLARPLCFPNGALQPPPRKPVHEGSRDPALCASGGVLVLANGTPRLFHR